MRKGLTLLTIMMALVISPMHVVGSDEQVVGKKTIEEGHTKNREDAEALFTRYMSMNYLFNPAITALYMHDAMVEKNTLYPRGKKKKKLKVTGLRWRSLFRELLPMMERQDDYSSFSNIKYEFQDDNSIVIRASRFGWKNCYWDHTFFLTVARDIRQDSRPMMVKEEYMEEPKESLCDQLQQDEKNWNRQKRKKYLEQQKSTN